MRCGVVLQVSLVCAVPGASFCGIDKDTHPGFHKKVIIGGLGDMGDKDLVFCIKHAQNSCPIDTVPEGIGSGIVPLAPPNKVPSNKEGDRHIGDGNPD